MPRNLNIFGGVFPFRKKIIDWICKTEGPFLKKHHANSIGKKLCCGRLPENGAVIDFAALFDIGVTGIAFMDNFIVLHDNAGTAGDWPLRKRI